MKESLHHFDFMRMSELLEGILYGSLGTELTHTAECLRHPRHTWERFGGAMHEFTFENLNGMLRAVKEVG